ncbi:hypothetical protein FOCC_FOCC012906 [Frankliniella occidentalis]|nr:hypothetical protein FOCC_FOCC012906 [Frankliniella occidentalis]
MLPSLTKCYDLRCIYNVDEFGLFFNMLPDKSMVIAGEDTHGNKHSKARLTVLLGSNADGTDKLPRLVIGKSVNPNVLSGIPLIPKFDARMRIQEKKALMFVDNCPWYSTRVELQNVKVIFSPKNCTSVLQPIDQGARACPTRA